MTVPLVLPRLSLVGIVVAAVVATPIQAVCAQQRSQLQSGVFVRQPTPNRWLGGSIRDSLPLQPPPRRSERARVALQFVAASVGAVASGFAGYSMLRDVSETRVKGDEGYTRSGNVGYLLGSFVGATFGAHVVGTRMGGKAPLWATSLGGLFGTMPLMLAGIDEPYLPLMGIALGWIPQAAMATGGFNMAERR